MPGIVGLITKMPRAQAEQELNRMVASIRHESFYETGTWIDESLGVYVGWAARKGSFSAGMPLRNERGNVTLIFSGEEYPEPGTILRLKEKGHELAAGDSAYLVHLYEEDPTFPANLNGRFHGLLIDQARGMATLFNDRFGMQRIYYHESSTAIYFAAEAKAILNIRPELRTTDARGMGELVSCGCVLENRSIFPGIQVLPAGSAWIVRNGTVESRKAYFDPQAWESQTPLDPETYYGEIKQVFSRILPRYFQGSERVGMSLTGGLDTRMIMAWYKAPDGEMPCYSFGGMFRDCEDVSLARRVAKECKQPFEVIEVGKEFLSNFAQYAERAVYLTDGCANVNRASDLYANVRAAKIAPARMTGNYGSEVLRRLPAFKAVNPSPGIFGPDILAQVAVAKKTYAGLLDRHAVSFIAFCQAPWHHTGLLGLEQTQLSLRSPYIDNDLVKMAFRAPDSSSVEYNIFDDNNEWVRLIGDGNQALRNIRTDRGAGGNDSKLGKAASRAWLEFSFKAEYAYDYGMPQWLAKIDHGLSWVHLERLFLGRHKFNHYRLWYRSALAPYIREMLLDPRALSRPYLERKNVEAMVRGHVAGTRNYTSEIHTILTLELFHRLFIDAH